MEEEKKKIEENKDEAPSWIGNGGKSNASNTTSKTSNYGVGTSYQEDLNALTEAQKRAQLNSLKQARDTALANLDAQEQEIKPLYQNQRNQVASTSKQNAKSFNEYLSNRGLTNSGASAQANINRQSTLQNNLANIGVNEANAYRDIANQRTQVNNDYINGVANANSQIEANYYNNLLNYNQQQREYIQNLQDQALGQYSNDYQAYMNTLDPNSLEYLQVAAKRGNKVTDQYTMGLQNALSNIQSGNINYNNASALGMTIDQAKQYYDNYQAQLQAQKEEEARQQALEEYYKNLDYTIKQKQLENATALNNSNIAKNTAASANYYDQIAKRGTNTNTPANNTTNTNGFSGTTSYSNEDSILSSRYAQKDFSGKDVIGYDTNGIKNQLATDLKNGAIKDVDAYALANKYGINYYQITPEYNQIWDDMGNTQSQQQALQVLAGYQSLNPNVDENIYKQLYNDLMAEY